MLEESNNYLKKSCFSPVDRRIPKPMAKKNFAPDVRITLSKSTEQLSLRSLRYEEISSRNINATFIKGVGIIFIKLSC